MTKNNCYIHDGRNRTVTRQLLLFSLYVSAQKTRRQNAHRFYVFIYHLWQFKGIKMKCSHFLTRNDVLWRISRKNPFRNAGCSLNEKHKNEENISHHKKRQNHVFGKQKPPEPIATQFSMPGAVHDVFTHVNFG